MIVYVWAKSFLELLKLLTELITNSICRLTY